MSHLTASQLDHLAQLLKERERVLRDEIRAHLLPEQRAPHVDLAGAVHDDGDEATANLLVDLDLAAVQRDLQELRDVQAAEARMTAGNYGVCMHCGVDVPYPRLVARPEARRCLACESERERRYAHHDRAR